MKNELTELYGVFRDGWTAVSSVYEISEGSSATFIVFLPKKTGYSSKAVTVSDGFNHMNFLVDRGEPISLGPVEINRNPVRLIMVCDGAEPEDSADRRQLGIRLLSICVDGIDVKVWN